MKRRRLIVVAVACLAVGLAAITLGPIAYSQVFRGVGDPHAPADRIKLNGRTYYLSKWPGPDTWESMLDYLRSEGTPLPDTRTMVRVGTPLGEAPVTGERRAHAGAGEPVGQARVGSDVGSGACPEPQRRRGRRPTPRAGRPPLRTR